MIVYLCTVGTGTAGVNSNVAEGIAAAIRLRNPGHCYLLPSTSPASIAVADLIKENVARDNIIIPNSNIFLLSNADDILSCRQEIRTIIRKFKKDMPHAEIILNPTGGTKQMTSAATLAAIDEGIERIEYISGPRQDGVIVTGKEEIASVSACSILAEYAGRNALLLLNGGAYQAAAELLQDYKKQLPQTYVAAAVLAARNRFNYRGAIQACNTMTGQFWQNQRQLLNQMTLAAWPSPVHLADMLNFVKRQLEFNEREEALAMLYRLCEAACKVRIRDEICGGKISTEAIIACPDISLNNNTKEKMRAQEREYGEPLLGLKDCKDMLRSSQFKLIPVLNDNQYWRTLQLRNKTRFGHDNQLIADAEFQQVKGLFAKIIEVLAEQWHALTKLLEQTSFNHFEPIIKEEIVNVKP
jgi:hypothetical protein